MSLQPPEGTLLEETVLSSACTLGRLTTGLGGLVGQLQVEHGSDTKFKLLRSFASSLSCRSCSVCIANEL